MIAFPDRLWINGDNVACLIRFYETKQKNTAFTDSLRTLKTMRNLPPGAEKLMAQLEGYQIIGCVLERQIYARAHFA